MQLLSLLFSRFLCPSSTVSLDFRRRGGGVNGNMGAQLEVARLGLLELNGFALLFLGIHSLSILG